MMVVIDDAVNNYTMGSNDDRDNDDYDYNNDDSNWPLSQNGCKYYFL